MTKANIELASLLASPQDCPLIRPAEQAEAIEYNDWHLGQSVMDHTLAVLRAVDGAIDEILPDMKIMRPYNSALAYYFKQSPWSCLQRRDLIKLAAVFHDIGKPGTLVRGAAGDTTCPGHAALGASQFAAQASHIVDLPGPAVSYVREIIALHHDLDTVMLGLDSETVFTKQRSAEFAHSNAILLRELVVFYIADYEGCFACSHVQGQKGRCYKAAADLLSTALEQQVLP